MTRSHAAKLIGLSPRQLDEAIRPRLPEGAQTGIGRHLRIDARQLVATLVEYRIEQNAPVTDDPDPLMRGVASPALEEYRQVMTRIQKLNLAEREVRLIPVDMLEQVHSQFAGPIRDCGDQLQRQFGSEAVNILNEAIDEGVSAVEKCLADARRKSDSIRNSKTGDAMQDAKASDHAKVRRGRNSASKRPVPRPAVSV